MRIWFWQSERFSRAGYHIGGSCGLNPFSFIWMHLRPTVWLDYPDGSFD